MYCFCFVVIYTFGMALVWKLLLPMFFFSNLLNTILVCCCFLYFKIFQIYNTFFNFCNEIHVICIFLHFSEKLYNFNTFTHKIIIFMDFKSFELGQAGPMPGHFIWTQEPELESIQKYPTQNHIENLQVSIGSKIIVSERTGTQKPSE